MAARIGQQEEHQQLVQKTRKKYKSAFLDNLFLMLESSEFSELVRWSEDGTYFKILQPKLFEWMVLPQFYKHSKLSSFIRQLNMYEFHKICRATDTDGEISYYHPYFQRNRRDLSERVLRMRMNRKPRKYNFNESYDTASLEVSEEMELTSEHSKKMVKLPENDFVESREENRMSDEQGEGFEEKAHRMEIIARFMIMKYGLDNENLKETDKPPTNEDIYEHFVQFSNDLFKLLEFDKIDKQYA